MLAHSLTAKAYLLMRKATILASCFTGISVFLMLFPGCSTTKPQQTYTSGTQRPYTIKGRSYSPLPSAVGYEKVGIASWYGKKFHGNPTANGETYNMYDLTAAHKVLPMNTILLVRNIENGKEVTVRVNDRGPFIPGRILDLSYGAAKKISLIKSGTAHVKITALHGSKDTKKTENIKYTKSTNLKSEEFYVQLGSFSVKDNALSLQKKFLDFGHKVDIVPTFIKGRSHYSVQLYVGKTLGEANIRERVLKDKGYSGTFIIAR